MVEQQKKHIAYKKFDSKRRNTSASHARAPRVRRPDAESADVIIERHLARKAFRNMKPCGAILAAAKTIQSDRHNVRNPHRVSKALSQSYELQGA